MVERAAASAGLKLKAHPHMLRHACVGHYENGDTLVIDTIGISAKSFVDNYRTPHTDQLHVGALEARGRRQDGGRFDLCRGPGRIHDTLDGGAALATR